MKIAIIGRSEKLYNTAVRLRENGHKIVCILTAKESPEHTCTADDYEALAEKWGIPFTKGPKIVEHTDFLKSIDADIAVSINYTGIVPQSVVDIFPLGILNAHAGDLPRYRGNACQAWAILNGENRIGLCVHKMIGEELDSGNIICRDYLSIDQRTKVTRVMEWLVQRIPELMHEAVEKLAADPNYYLEQQSKDPKSALRCYPRKPEDGQINWNKSAIEILRLINACNKPYSGAFCSFEGESLIIWDAELVEDEENFLAIPGQVIKVGEEFLQVACGSGKLQLNIVEYHGEVTAPATFIKSIRKRLT